MVQLNLHKNLNSAIGKMQLDFSLEISEGTFLSLYGKSGAGKTSALRMLAGLMTPESGQIIVHGETWYDGESKINLPPQQRSIGLVFQDYALFPNMTVKGNLEFALTKNTDKKIIDELIEIVELGALRDRKPATLSGGQQQRVALARALVQRPKLLLLDEPLSAIDLEMRQKLQEYILKLHTEFKLTTVLVSHDIPEVLKLSDHVVHLEEGKIIKQGNPLQVLNTISDNTIFSKTGELIAIEKEIDKYKLTILVNARPIEISVDEAKFLALLAGKTNLF